MFSKLKRRFDVKGKRAVALLATVTLLCSFTGCVGNEEGSGQSEFDFDEAVKNITLFGSKISLPCTIADFGEDYSLSEDNLTTFGDISSCSILYQGKSVGTVSLTGCKDGEPMNDKQIISLSLGFIAKDVGANDSLKEALYESRGWYSGLIEVDFAGLSFETTRIEAEKVFGDPYNSGNDFANYKIYSNDRSKSVEVKFYMDKVKQITIYM